MLASASVGISARAGPRRCRVDDERLRRAAQRLAARRRAPHEGRRAEGRVRVPVDDEARERQPSAQLVDAAGAARSSDRISRLQEPRVLRRQRRSCLRRRHRSRAASVDDRPQLLGADRRSAIELDGMSWRPDRDAKPPHRARDCRADRGRRWTRRRSQRQRGWRTRQRRSGAGPAAGPTRRPSCGARPWTRSRADWLRPRRSAVCRGQRRLHPQPVRQQWRGDGAAGAVPAARCQAIGADLDRRHRLHDHLRRVRRGAERGVGDGSQRAGQGTESRVVEDGVREYRRDLRSGVRL